MKKLTLILCVVGLVLIASVLFWRHEGDSGGAPITEAHTYMIAPNEFFAGLQHLIVPKTGESHLELLARYFQQQKIHLEGTNAVGFFPQEATGTGRLQVRVTAADREKVERLIVSIAQAK